MLSRVEEAEEDELEELAEDAEDAETELALHQSSSLVLFPLRSTTTNKRKPNTKAEADAVWKRQKPNNEEPRPVPQLISTYSLRSKTTNKRKILDTKAEADAEAVRKRRRPNNKEPRPVLSTTKRTAGRAVPPRTLA